VRVRVRVRARVRVRVEEAARGGGMHEERGRLGQPARVGVLPHGAALLLHDREI